MEYEKKPNNPYFIVSNQNGVHEGLSRVLLKHKQSSYRKPIRKINMHAFEDVLPMLVENNTREIILDSGCGEGESSFILANQNPDKLVISIDKSIHRLKKVRKRCENNIFIYGDCVDIWRLLLPYKERICSHYILYPNPWPKKKHLKRRWYAHPILPTCFQLSNKLIIRSNWQQYLLDFAVAAEFYGYNSEMVSYKAAYALTKFEEKYWRVGCKTFQLVVNLE